MPKYERSPATTVATLTVTAGPLLLPNGTVAAPSLAFTSATGTGFWLGTRLVFSMAGDDSFALSTNTALLPSNGLFAWTDGAAATGTADVRLLRDAAGTLALKNSTNAQVFNHYGSEITAGTRYSRLAIKHAVANVTAAVGATATASNLIPAKANVLGVNTVVTTALGNGTGTTGYAVGDGTDPNRWGDVVGIVAGTDTDQTDATADPTGWFNAANNVVLTAAGGNFDGTGVIFVDVAYTMTEAE